MRASVAYRQQQMDMIVAEQARVAAASRVSKLSDEGGAEEEEALSEMVQAMIKSGIFVHLIL